MIISRRQWRGSYGLDGVGLASDKATRPRGVGVGRGRESESRSRLVLTVTAVLRKRTAVKHLRVAAFFSMAVGTSSQFP